MIQQVLFLLLATSVALAADAPPKPPAPAAASPKGKAPPAAAKPPPPFVSIDPGKTDDDFPFAGEFVGKMRESALGIQIIPWGKGQFDAVICPGGLPGAGWTRQPAARQRVNGRRETEGGNTLRFSANGWLALLKGDEIQLQDFKGTPIGQLSRVRRASPTLGATPPPGAVVLFEGKNLDAFEKGARATPDGLLMEGATTKEAFGNCSLHLEFMLSYMPEARGQGRSNSGVYLQSRYEVQVLDSFGLSGENNECGGIYTIAKPEVNMCLPPLTWQTYDIDFQAPAFDATGNKTSDATMTVKHNGVLVHEEVKVPHLTRAAPSNKEAATGPLHLQNHGNSVRYRNIWVVKK